MIYIQGSWVFGRFLADCTRVSMLYCRDLWCDPFYRTLYRRLCRKPYKHEVTWTWVRSMLLLFPRVSATVMRARRCWRFALLPFFTFLPYFTKLQVQYISIFIFSSVFNHKQINDCKAKILHFRLGPLYYYFVLFTFFFYPEHTSCSDAWEIGN